MSPRDLWTLGEPLHAVVYFAPQVAEAARAAGMRGFWSGYFGMRFASLGPVPAPVVVALAHGFEPGFVARWVPGVWATVSPDDALAARRAGVGAALRDVLGAAGATSDVDEAAALVRRAAGSVDPVGRALAAGEASVDLPADALGALWQSLTVLREHRGDGHVAALTVHELDGLAAHVVRVLAAGGDPDWLLRARGWTRTAWDDAVEQLVGRGLVAGGRLTEAGHALRAGVEDTTDRLAAGPWAALTDAEQERLAEILRPARRAVVEAGLFPAGNPIGVPEPSAG